MHVAFNLAAELDTAGDCCSAEDCVDRLSTVLKDDALAKDQFFLPSDPRQSNR